MIYSLKPRPIVFSVLVAGLYLANATDAVAQDTLADSQTEMQSLPHAQAHCSQLGYITTGTTHRTYQLDFATSNNQLIAGRYTHESTDDIAQLDAFGYNSIDSYLYAWDHTHNKPVRINQTGSVEILDVRNTIDAKFFAGDVSLIRNRFYVYRPGQAYGLYYLELDTANADYGQMMHVANSERINLHISDIAFHPEDDFAYAVDNAGDIHQIDTENATSTNLGNTGLTGRFGSAFFDDAGDLTIGQNHSGNVYKIPLSSGAVGAVFVSKGPSATLSDGFRCAHAPFTPLRVATLSSAEAYDFGNAPNSYGTTLSANGARHSLGSRYLGNDISVESNAYVYPLTDTVNDLKDNGISFITTLVENQTAHIQVNSVGGGYLSAWIDANRSGEFDQDEQVLQDHTVVSGQQRITFTMPHDVNVGDSWARFRLSGTEGVSAVGQAPDGEVEDYPVVVLEESLVVASYPSKKGFATVAFEDNWPFIDDYDMNDLVTQLRTHTYRNELGYTRVDISGTITAVGSQYENGFAIRLPGVARSAINEQDLEFSVNGYSKYKSPLELNREEAIFIITENASEQVSAGPFCKYHRTEPGCGAQTEFEFKLSIRFNEPQTVELKGVFDPFLFATPGAFHGAHFKTPPGRSYEVHLKNQAPTEAFDLKLFGAVGQDRTSQQNGTYFHTANGMPWALEIGGKWSHPQEISEIAEAYPRFKAWAESSGTVNKAWYLPEHTSSEHVFKQ